MGLRLVFMGTPDFAVPSLVEIVGSGHELAAVYTRPAKPAGRGMALNPSPVEREAQRLGLRVLRPTGLRMAGAETVARGLAADAAVVVAYGLILPKPILEAFRFGCFNLHASLLPRWRGAAPINRAILAGDSESGVTVMKMDEGLDTGPIAMADRVAIGADETAGELHDRLARRGADLMLRALGALERGSLVLAPQPQLGASLAPKIENKETRIVWDRSWDQVHNRIRGLSPYPGAWCELVGEGASARVRVLRSTRGEGSGLPGTVLDGELTIACGEGAVRLLELQRAGRQAMKAQEFIRGARILPGSRFG